MSKIKLPKHYDIPLTKEELKKGPFSVNWKNVAIRLQELESENERLRERIRYLYYQFGIKTVKEVQAELEALKGKEQGDG